MLRLFGSGDIKLAVREYLATRGDLAGRRVVDIPAGKGDMSDELRRLGADVEAYDLFPDAFAADGLTCRHADLRDRLPIADRHADVVLCQEAIEHLQDPLTALCELNRILRPGGSLILTTPNVSHLRARVSRLLIEGELYNRLPPSESDAVWAQDGGRRYFGHAFLVGVQQLRLLARLAGFRVARIVPVKISASSALLAFLYPALAAASLFAYWRTRRRGSGADDAAYREIVRLNLHPTVLFGKHLFVEFTKETDPAEVDLDVRKNPATIR